MKVVFMLLFTNSPLLNSKNTFNNSYIMSKHSQNAANVRSSGQRPYHCLSRSVTKISNLQFDLNFLSNVNISPEIKGLHQFKPINRHYQ